MNATCNYCNENVNNWQMCFNEVVCQHCLKWNKEIEYKRVSYYDALTIQIYYKLHKNIRPKQQVYENWEKNKDCKKCMKISVAKVGKLTNY